MLDEMAELSIKHLKPNDFIYVSGHLGSYTKADVNAKLVTKYKVIVKEINYVMQHGQLATCQKSEQSESGQVFVNNPNEWQGYRKSKVKPNYPDFKHKDTGEALWLSTNDPPWIKRQLQLQDSRLEEGSQGEDIIIKYSNFRDPEGARSLFDDIHHGPNSFLWNTMLRAYANGGHCSQALELYSLMRKTGIEPNNYTFPFVLKACASESLSIQGKLVHCDVIRTGFNSVEAALVDVYEKCGLIDDGQRGFDRMSKRDLVCWTAMITAYEQAERPQDSLILFNKMQQESLSMDWVTALSVASAVGHGMHGHGNEALELLSQMQEEGVQPSHITFTSILSACSHAGLINEGRKCFADMTKFCVIYEAKHYACMVDMLGRAGLLYEAYDLIKKMPSKPNDGVWGALLLACRNHGNASTKWHEVGELRQNMKSTGLRKPAAFSVIEFGKEVHGFHTAECRPVESILKRGL
ncbi:hypothetical protein F0562_003014 [Nyssa sinensis]|uniref:Pentatricopeptide repeat-containing protein n=1 Tax=Nyssa sinensis TaxID=561372 RepID=A0A5J5BX26_9ASTE|nr:hypothetical protein F0562_003014 [Nyssa sinensis]